MQNMVFTITAIVGDRAFDVPVTRKYFGSSTWYEVNVQQLFPDVAPITSIANSFGEWLLWGLLTELTIDDIQAIGWQIDLANGDIDETDYLLSSEANRQMLEKAIKQVENGEGKFFGPDDFQDYIQ